MIGIVCQARSKSSRFPRKIWEVICGKSTLQWVLNGVSESKLSQKIILAMPTYDQKETENALDSGKLIFPDHRFDVFFGEPDDVLKRYYDAASKFGIDIIVRVTCDCPLINGQLIDHMLAEYLTNGYNGFMGCNDLVSSVPYPNGIDCDIFKWHMLAESHWRASESHDREHVTPYMYRDGSQYNIYQFLNKTPNPVISTKIYDLSFDTDDDFNMLKNLIDTYNLSLRGGLDSISSLNKAIKDFIK